MAIINLIPSNEIKREQQHKMHLANFSGFITHEMRRDYERE